MGNLRSAFQAQSPFVLVFQHSAILIVVLYGTLEEETYVPSFYSGGRSEN